MLGKTDAIIVSININKFPSYLKETSRKDKRDYNDVLFNTEKGV